MMRVAEWSSPGRPALGSLHPVADNSPIAWVTRSGSEWFVELCAQAAGLPLGTAALGMTAVTAGPNEDLAQMGIRTVLLQRDPREPLHIRLWADPWPGLPPSHTLRCGTRPWPDTLERFPPLAQNNHGAAGLLCVQLILNTLKIHASPDNILMRFEQVAAAPWSGQGLVNVKRVQSLLIRFGVTSHEPHTTDEIALACESGAAAFLVLSSSGRAHPLVRINRTLYDPHDFTRLGCDWVDGNRKVGIARALIVAMPNATAQQLAAMQHVSKAPPTKAHSPF